MIDKPIKIAILLPSFSVGGAERLIIEELAYFCNDSRFRFEVELVFEPGGFYDAFAHMGHKVRVWNVPHKSPLMILGYLKIVAYLRRANFHIFHCHLLNTLGPLIGRLAGIKKVITTVHTDVRFSKIEQWCLNQSHVLLACGKQVENNLKQFCGNRKVLLIPNAVSEPCIDKVKTKEISESLGIGDNVVLLSLGSLSWQKGYDGLLQAVKFVRERHNQIVLLIGGEGSEKKSLQRMIEAMDISENVRLLGIVGNVHSIFPLVDIYVNSSRWEGLPMTLLEAAAHGKAMIATNVGGNREVVQEGKTGLLVPPDDSLSLANAICSLIENSDLRDKMGYNSRKLYLEKYGIEKHCEKLASIYYG